MFRGTVASLLSVTYVTSFAPNQGDWARDLLSESRDKHDIDVQRALAMPSYPPIGHPHRRRYRFLSQEATPQGAPTYFKKDAKTLAAEKERREALSYDEASKEERDSAMLMMDGAEGGRPNPKEAFLTLAQEAAARSSAMPILKEPIKEKNRKTFWYNHSLRDAPQLVVRTTPGEYEAQGRGEPRGKRRDLGWT